MRHGDYAWAALGAGILVYEVLAPQGELLSEACDRYRRRHPILTTALVLYVAAHLLRRVPARVDPLHRLTGLRR